MNPNVDMTVEDYKQSSKRPVMPVPVVWPDGRVTEHVLGDPSAPEGHPHHPDSYLHANGGFVVARFVEGRPIITAYGLQQGCELFEDVCRKDGEPEKFEAWKKAVAARLANAHVTAPESAIYPTSVIAARRRHAALDGATRKVELQEDSTSEEKVRAKLASLGITPDADSDAKDDAPPKAETKSKTKSKAGDGK